MNREQGSLQGKSICDLKAERLVLGGILFNNFMLHKLTNILEEDDFYFSVHRVIYETCLDLTKRSVVLDFFSLTEEFGRMGKLAEIGGSAYIAELASCKVGPAKLQHYAVIVHEIAIQRKLTNSGLDNVDRENENDEPLRGVAGRSLLAVSKSTHNTTLSSAKEIVDDVFHNLTIRKEKNEMVTGVPTGFYHFDECTAGLQPSELIIVAGYPLMGKTSFARDIAMRAACMYGVPTLVFSMEMSKEQVMTHMLCAWGKVNLTSMRKGHLNETDWSRLHDAADTISPSPIFVDDTPALSVMELRARCHLMKAKHGLGLVVVDNLDLMRSERRMESRVHEISDIVQGLKDMAKELHVPVVVLSQASDNIDAHTVNRNLVNALRESGNFEHNADVIIFLQHEEFNDKTIKPTQKDCLAKILIAKQRRGLAAIVKLRFLREFASFENPTKIPQQDEFMTLMGGEPSARHPNTRVRRFRTKSGAR